MIVLKAGPHTLLIFDSIHTIPPHRESLMNYYLMTDAGIGHTMHDINSHLSSIEMATLYGKKEDLALHMENLKLCFATIAGEYNPKFMAWLCLIDEVNGEKFTDTSEEGLIKLGKMISEEGGVGLGWELVLQEVKKKLPTEWLYTFPSGE